MMTIRKLTLFFIVFVMLFACLSPVAMAHDDIKLNDAERRISDGLFGTDEKEENENGPKWPVNKIIESFSWFFGDLITGFVGLLGLKDPGELIFHNSTLIGEIVESETGSGKRAIYNTFTQSMWNIIDTFYQIVKGSVGYMLLVALVVWGFLLVFRSDTTMGQFGISEMVRGFVTFFILMLGMSYFIELFFDVNDLIVKWSKRVVSSFSGANNVAISVDDVSLLNVLFVAVGTKYMQSSDLVLGIVPALLIILAVIVVIGLINYQYAVRMVALGILIIIYPIVAFASIFPARQKAFDMWAREFASQVFMNASHAIIWAFFFLLLYNNASFWILIPMLFSLPTLTSLVRMMFGAQMGSGVGGAIGGVMGFAAVRGISSIMRGVRGEGQAGGATAATRGSVVRGTGNEDAVNRGTSDRLRTSKRNAGSINQQQRPRLRHGVARGAKRVATGVAKVGTIGAAATGASALVGAATGNLYATEGAALAGGKLASDGLNLLKSNDGKSDSGESTIPTQAAFSDQYNSLTNEHKDELQQLFPNVDFKALTKKPNPMASKLAKEVSNLAPSQQAEIQKLLPRVQFEGRSPNLVASQLASEFMNAKPDIQKQVAQMMPVMRDFKQLPSNTQSRITNDLMQTDNSYNEAVESIKEQYQSMPTEQQARAVELMPALQHDTSTTSGEEKSQVLATPKPEKTPSTTIQHEENPPPQHVEPPYVDPPSRPD